MIDHSLVGTVSTRELIMSSRLILLDVKQMLDFHLQHLWRRRLTQERPKCDDYSVISERCAQIRSRPERINDPRRR